MSVNATFLKSEKKGRKCLRSYSYLYLLLGAVKINKIRSQNWLPGKFSMAMKAKYPQSTEVGIFFRKGIAATHPPTIKDCSRLLTRCSLTSTGNKSSISFSMSNTDSSTGAFILPMLDANWIVDSFNSLSPCQKEFGQGLIITWYVTTCLN